MLLRREVLFHELVSREQRAFGVGRHGTESRPQAEREAQGVEGLLRDARARGIAAERERCRRLERVRLPTADGELAQLGVEVEGAEKQGLVIPVDRVPRCGEAHGGDGLRDGVVEERRQRREPVRPEVAAGGVRRAVGPDRFRPRLHALERGTRPRIDAEPVEKVDVPAQFATRMHICAVAGHDGRAHRGARDGAVAQIRHRLRHRGDDVRAERILRMESRAPGSMVLHDHGLDPPG